MRALFAAAALAITLWSIFLDREHASPDSWLCRQGACRIDQMFSAIDTGGMDLGNVSALLSQDPSNPLVWTTFAQLLSVDGQTERAAEAYDRAVALGPGMSPVLMRAANFDFAQGRLDQGFEMTRRILGQTNAFDQVLFSYLTRTGLPVSKLADAAVPPLPSTAKAWLTWQRKSGSDADLRELWSWMRKNQLVDQKSATDFAWAFWRRKAFATARDTWMEWLGRPQGPQWLANVSFKDEPDGSPFDWTLTPTPGVEIQRNGGLEVRFSGNANVDFSGVNQFTTVNAGRYRFSAEIETPGITTDQGPRFHIFDAANPGRLSVESSPVRGTTPRSWIHLDVPVSGGTQALEIQIERRPSQKFDNKIEGTLHVYQVSLLPEH